MGVRLQGGPVDTHHLHLQDHMALWDNVGPRGWGFQGLGGRGAGEQGGYQGRREMGVLGSLANRGVPGAQVNGGAGVPWEQGGARGAGCQVWGRQGCQGRGCHGGESRGWSCRGKGGSQD